MISSARRLTRTGHGGSGGSSGATPVGPSRGHDVDSLAGEMRGVVEDAGVAESVCFAQPAAPPRGAGPRSGRAARHRSWPGAARSGEPVHALHLDEQPGPFRRPANGLRGEGALDPRGRPAWQGVRCGPAPEAAARRAAPPAPRRRPAPERPPRRTGPRGREPPRPRARRPTPPRPRARALPGRGQRRRRRPGPGGPGESRAIACGHMGGLDGPPAPTFVAPGDPGRSSSRHAFRIPTSRGVDDNERTQAFALGRAHAAHAREILDGGEWRRVARLDDPRCASAGPMPGRRVSSSAVARFRSIGAPRESGSGRSFGWRAGRDGGAVIVPGWRLGRLLAIERSRLSTDSGWARRQRSTASPPPKAATRARITRS